MNNDTSRNIGKSCTIEYKNLFAFGRSSNHFIGCIANIVIVILNSIVFLNHKAVIGKVIALTFRFVVGRVKVLECTAGYIDVCCSVRAIGIIAVQNELITLCRIRIFLLNRVGSAFDISCSSKNIYSMDITNEGTIFDSNSCTFLHINCIAVVFFGCKGAVAGNGQITTTTDRNQRPIIIFSCRLIPQVTCVIQFLTIHV